MTVPPKKSPRSRKGKRAAHQKLKKVNLKKCPQCGTLIPSHQVCPNCGSYKGKNVLKLKVKKKK